jgi:hypothetical protein
VPVSPVIANCVEVRLLWNYAGALAVNVLHAQAAAGVVVNQALANTVGAAIKTAFQSNLATHCNTNTDLVRVGVRDLRAPAQAEYLDAGAATPGTSVGEPLPPQIALNVTLRTAQAGKSYRGRVYLGGFTETDNELAGSATPALSTAAVAFIQAVSGALTSSQLTLAVAGHERERYVDNRTIFHSDGTTTVKEIGKGSAGAAHIAPVTLVQSRQNNWETQRRRGNGRGALPTLLNPIAEAQLA